MNVDCAVLCPLQLFFQQGTETSFISYKVGTYYKSRIRQSLG